LICCGSTGAGDWVKTYISSVCLALAAYLRAANESGACPVFDLVPFIKLGTAFPALACLGSDTVSSLSGDFDYLLFWAINYGFF
jgi:hypothetical protein